MWHMIIIIQRVLSPLKKNKPWTLLSSFLNDNIRWDSAKLQKQKFIYLQTAVTSETKSFFFFFLQSLVGVSLASKHNKDPSAELFFLTQQTFPPPPTPRSLVQREQLNCIAQKLYIGLGNIKGGRKTDSDEHYIATSAKCIVRRIREIIREATKASFLFPLITASGTSTTCLYWTCALCTLRTAARFLTESMNNVARSL